MKLLLLFFSLGWAALLTQCTHQPTTSYDLSSKDPVVYRFQNTLGLQTTKVGCSLGNLGGIDLMNKKAASHPVDLSFQVGPSFFPLITGPFVGQRLKEERKKVWQAWDKQKVSFYSVDALDLIPSLDEFKQSAQKHSIDLLSSNIRSKEGNTYPFKPFLVLKAAGKTVAILSFSEGAPDNTSSWTLKKAPDSFLEVRNLIPHPVDIIYVLGSLLPETRLALAKISKEPVLFIGGTRLEKNSTALTKIHPNAYWVKSPDYGMGYSEIKIGTSAKTSLGGINHSFSSTLLNEDEPEKASCETTPE